MKRDKILASLTSRRPSILGLEEFRKYAVLVPLVENDDGLHVLFEVRSNQLRRQPGEICFPGGKMDKQDKTNQYTAIRETTEELGIVSTQIKDVYPLDYLVTAFSMVVYPHVGFIEDYQTIKPNPDEVDEVFTVPLSFFLDNGPVIHRVHLHIEPEKNFPFELIIGGENYEWGRGVLDEYFYQYEDKVIWGLTARILAHFIETISKDS